MMNTPPQRQPMVLTPEQQELLASHLRLISQATKLSDAVINGTRDPNSIALVNEPLKNSISGSSESKTMTVDGQKQNLEENDQLLQQRRDLIVEDTKSVEAVMKSET